MRIRGSCTIPYLHGNYTYFIVHRTLYIVHYTWQLYIVHYTFYIIHHIPLSSTISQSSIFPFSLSKFTPTFVIGKFDKEKRLR